MADLSAEGRKKSAKKGHALPGGRFPIENKADLQNAIRAVGRGKGSHDAIRRYIIRRARELGASGMIPSNWNADGSIG